MEQDYLPFERVVKIAMTLDDASQTALLMQQCEMLIAIQESTHLLRLSATNVVAVTRHLHVVFSRRNVVPVGNWRHC